LHSPTIATVLFLKKTKIGKAVYGVPSVIMACVIIAESVLIFMEKVYVVTDNSVELFGLPVIFSVINILLVLYNPLVAIIKRKEIGYKTTFLLSIYWLVPCAAILILVGEGGYDFSAVAGGFAMLTACVLLQTSISREKDHKYKELIEKQNDELTERLNVINSVAKAFNSIYYVDMSDYSFIELGTNLIGVRDVIGTEGDARDSFERMYKYLVYPEYVESVREFTDLTTVNARLKHKSWISCQFCGPKGGWSEGVFIAASRDNNGDCDHVIWATRNVDENKRREIQYREALEMATEEAKSANAAKTTFLFNMSHDIRTPMNAILGFAKLMERDINNPEKMKRYLEKIEISGEYLLNLINNLLEIARIDSGKEIIDESFTDLMDGKCSVAPLLENELSRKNLIFTNQINIQHRYVYADMQKIKEITMNLMSNAIKYTPEGGHIHLQFDEVPSDREGYGKYVNSISDDGIGMSEEFQKQLFDSFTREHNSTESKVIGTGLGMSIVKKIVDLMGGEIEVESAPGKGSTFKIIIYHRIVENPEEFIGKQQEADSLELGALAGKRILLAEDNEFNAEITVEILNGLGLVVEVAEDGLICVEKVEKASPGYYDLIFMDIQMPNMNGYDATVRIREMDDPEKSGIPIVAMTANAFEEDRRNALNAGMNEHLAKPIEMPKLIETLLKYIG